MELEKVGNYRTCLEKQMHGYLIELGLKKGKEFYEQHPSGSFVLDFAFVLSDSPFRGLCIETDGLKWHSSPKQRQRDGFRTHKLKQKGWIIERFKENFTISDVESVLKKHGIVKPSL